MSVAPNDRHSTGEEERSADRTRYPENHVVAVLDTREQLTAAVAALTGGGFLDSEIQLRAGHA